ncbi:ABC transporter permease, partial [archaeon]|nr:ABC transporter permease [archaeon]
MKVKRAYRVWQRHLTVYTKLYLSSIALNFVEPILYLVALGFGLGGFITEVQGRPYINFIAPGIIASSSMFATVYECTYATYVRIFYQKTFDAILSTPVNIDDLIAGEIMWGATKSVLYGIIIIATISAFRLVDSPLILIVVPILFLSGIIFAEISLVCVALVPGVDSLNYFYT